MLQHSRRQERNQTNKSYVPSSLKREPTSCPLRMVRVRTYVRGHNYYRLVTATAACVGR